MAACWSDEALTDVTLIAYADSGSDAAGFRVRCNPPCLRIPAHKLVLSRRHWAIRCAAAPTVPNCNRLRQPFAVANFPSVLMHQEFLGLSIDELVHCIIGLRRAQSSIQRISRIRGHFEMVRLGSCARRADFPRALQTVRLCRLPPDYLAKIAVESHPHGLGVGILAGVVYAIGGHDGWSYLKHCRALGTGPSLGLIVEKLQSSQPALVSLRTPLLKRRGGAGVSALVSKEAAAVGALASCLSSALVTTAPLTCDCVDL
uniref:BTB domain-containing protein n=1 Tax=Macrostomum lignano TaxID=282301 RepID=A0A1I8FBQ2_9PLAT